MSLWFVVPSEEGGGDPVLMIGAEGSASIISGSGSRTAATDVRAPWPQAEAMRRVGETAHPTSHGKFKLARLPPAFLRYSLLGIAI